MKIQFYTALGGRTNLQDEAIEKFRLALLSLRDFGNVRALPNATYDVLNAMPGPPPVRMIKTLIYDCYRKNGDILAYDNAQFERVCKPTRLINPNTGEIFKFSLNSFFTTLVRTAKTILKKSV